MLDFILQTVYHGINKKGEIMKIQTSVRVDNTLYDEARTVFSKFGLTFGDAVNIFLAKVAMEKAIPSVSFL